MDELDDWLRADECRYARLQRTQGVLMVLLGEPMAIPGILCDRRSVVAWSDHRPGVRWNHTGEVWCGTAEREATPGETVAGAVRLWRELYEGEEARAA